jgi:plastocyanin
MLRSVIAALGLLLLMTAACGGSAPAQPAGSTRVVMSEFKFDPSTISVPAGKASFFLVNSGSAPHNMVILGPDGKRLAASELVQGGGSSTFTAQLSAGSYRFICDQPGHEQAGMKGTLTVT